MFSWNYFGRFLALAPVNNYCSGSNVKCFGGPGSDFRQIVLAPESCGPRENEPALVVLNIDQWIET